MARKKVSNDFSDVCGAPSDQAWVWLPQELATSPAWRGQSIHCWRFVNFLIVENMAHRGRENGDLVATYDQLEDWGIGRKYIAEAINEATKVRKIVGVKRGGWRTQGKKHPSRYRLTWLASKGSDAHSTYYVAPGDDWRRASCSDIEAFKKEKAATRARGRKEVIRVEKKGQTQVHTAGTKSVHTVGTKSVHTVGTEHLKTAYSFGSHWGNCYLYLGYLAALLREAVNDDLPLADAA